MASSEIGVLGAYEIAIIALTGLPLIASIVLFYCSFFLVRKKKDPVRTCFIYLQVGLFMYAGVTFWNTLYYVLELVRETTGRNYYGGSLDDDDIGVAALQFSALGQLADGWSAVAVFNCLVLLGSAIGVVHEGREKPLYKFVRPVTYGISGVLGLLIFVGWPIRIRLYLDFQSRDATLFNSERRLNFAVSVFLFILALSVLARSVMIVMETRGDQRVKQLSTLLTVCATLFLLRTTYVMASIAAYQNLQDFREDRPSPYYVFILGIIFGIWPLFIILSIIFSIGAKKINGIWSTGPHASGVVNGGYAVPFEQKGVQMDGYNQQQYAYNNQHPPQYHELQPGPNPAVRYHELQPAQHQGAGYQGSGYHPSLYQSSQYDSTQYQGSQMPSTLSSSYGGTPQPHPSVPYHNGQYYHPELPGGPPAAYEAPSSPVPQPNYVTGRQTEIKGGARSELTAAPYHG